MASDLTHLNFKVEFEKGTPFRPVDQLMAVLSPRSAHAIPSCLRPLMEDKNSPIIDFYPKDFVTDTEGKKAIYYLSKVCLDGRSYFAFY
jgi:5'-3' exoribonuclease 2